MNKSCVFLCAVLLTLGCAKPQPQPFQVIPMPAEVSLSDGSFCVKGVAVSVDSALDAPSRAAVSRFVQALETATGRPVKTGEGGLHFGLNPNLAAEQYYIQVKQDGALVEASALNGFVYACETLKQMLPAAIYGNKKASGNWVLPCVTILDQPRFGYRGAHLDPCRHYWSVEETKRIIDVMAAYKLNRLHWHLTDDQGWRIEIKRFPKLTEVGAWRRGTQIGKDRNTNDGIPHGGFYTQEQLRDVVAYAAARGITVVPEVELPGHSAAALASYPELGCTGGPYEVFCSWSGAADIMCAGSEAVFTFLEGVFQELTDIFPSEYYHIGGDECFPPRRPAPWELCPKCAARMRSLGIRKGPGAKHELQGYVTARVQKILSGLGKKIIGWDEILEAELTPGATVMSWRGVKGGIEAASKGFDVIMAPNSYMYIDYYQGQEKDKEPLAIGGYNPVEKVYSYEPMDGMPEGAEDHILGVQCNLWTEYIATPEHLEYMLLPRLCAAAEVQWCAPGAKDFKRFDASLDHTFQILDAMGVNYCLTSRGLVGLDRIPARDSVALAEYLSAQ